jgi:cell division septation protein DedD
MADEEFHEIQLNGKQLVFLFMAGTVAAVVIFLCGLMVGRNLRVPRLEAAAANTEAVVTDPTRPPDALVPPAPAEANTSGPPVSTTVELTYSSRLEDPTPVEETLKPADVPAGRNKAPEKAPASSKAARAETPAPKPLADPVAKSAPAATNVEPPGNGWVVQVQASRSRAEAEALARRLNAKGYPTFVTPRGSGSLLRYGVRVGKFAKKGDAEAMKTRLEKEEQFKPWVTR